MFNYMEHPKNHNFNRCFMVIQSVLSASAAFILIPEI